MFLDSRVNEIRKGMEEEKIVKVSDWSQKYKLAIYAISGIGLIYLGYRVVSLLTEIRDLLSKSVL